LTRIPFTYTWIEQGKILAGSIPQVPDDVAILKSLGIQAIISLTRRDIETYPEMVPVDFIRGNFPIPDNGIGPDEIMTGAVDALDYFLSRQYSTYIHCRGGIGRTGVILLAYYVNRRGLSLAQAKEIVKVRRNYQGNASAIDQGSPQREWIDALEKRK
jgi:hypothetical protein